MWHSARASTGSDRSRLQPPSEVSVASSAWQPAVVVEADPPLGVEAVPLAGHRHVLGAVQPQPDRAAGEGRAERGDRGEAVRLHLLAAEPAAHPQALHGDVVAGEPEHVGDDLLRLGRVLGAALHEDLAALVDQGQRRSASRGRSAPGRRTRCSPLKTWAAPASPASTSPRSTAGWAPWKLLGRDRLASPSRCAAAARSRPRPPRRRAGRPRASRRAPSRRRGRRTSPRSGTAARRA